MTRIQESIDVNVPVTTAYNQWTQFEEFPLFMDGIEDVRQLDDTHLHWVAKVGGKELEWDAEISEQKPDERIAWRSTGGVKHDGLVTFQPVGDNRTRVTVEMEWEPERLVERGGAALGLDERQVRGDLERFKEMIESRSQETGEWRGTVERPGVPS